MVTRMRSKCDDFKFASRCQESCGLCGVAECEGGRVFERIDGQWVCVLKVEEPEPRTTTLEGPMTTQPEEYMFPDENGEDKDYEYFRIKDEPTPKPKPRELGMASTLIRDPQITATSFTPGFEPATARPFSVGGWVPANADMRPYLQIDLRIAISVHGFGTLGGYNVDCWTTGYHVQYSTDGVNFEYLVDTSKDMVDGSHPPRYFVGNNGRNVWKRHCVHKYYGEPIDMKVIRFYPVTDSQNNRIAVSPRNEQNGCVAMRVELYGFRDANDPQLIRAMKRDVWTVKPRGCTCYFDTERTDCACCAAGGCQCSEISQHQCVQCGYGTNCGVPELPHWLFLLDGWTTARQNCQCRYDPTLFTCACCNEKRNGVQCPLKEHSNQCVQPGAEAIQCGEKENIFGPNKVCVPKTCPVA